MYYFHSTKFMPLSPAGLDAKVTVCPIYNHLQQGLVDRFRSWPQIPLLSSRPTRRISASHRIPPSAKTWWTHHYLQRNLEGWI